MRFRVDHADACLTLYSDTPLVSLRYWHNLFHYHQDVFQLEFDLHQPLRRPELVAGVHTLLSRLRELLPETATVCRVTVSNPSELLSVLRAVGCLETRYIYEPVLDPLTVQVKPRGFLTLAGRRFDILPLANLDERAEPRLLSTFIDIYSAVPRLDPVTPEHVLRRDWRALLENGLAREASIVLLERSLPIGLATVYAESSSAYQLGVMGVQEKDREKREPLLKAMLEQVISRLQSMDARQLRVEIDTDDPELCYTCSSLPFIPDRVSTSLMWVPRWSQTAGLD